MSYLSFVFLCVVALCGAYDWDEPTALDEYVHFDDGFFSWSEIGQYRFDDDNLTVYLLNMTSQKWLDETVSDHPIWWHMMGVAVPDVIREDVGFIYIEGGSNDENTSPPDPDDGVVNAVRLYASMTGYVAAFLRQVPNQAIIFANDPTGEERTEDEFIAWTWHTYVLEMPDTPQVIARMPMTKSVIRAMDAITELVAEKAPGHDVQRFIVGGGSKRGWTAWSTAATDQRVIAVTPMVMSLLNFNDTLQAHYRNLGGWSWVFNDYYVLNLTNHIHDDKVTNWADGLWTYEDMFRYKERLALIPKLLISATGDEFFLLTDTLTWWDDMYGDKWIMMNQNAEHSLAPYYVKIGETVASWSMLLVEGPAVPKLDWQIGDTGHSARVSLFVDQIPDNITGWYAYSWQNETRKDFRLVVDGDPPTPHLVRWFRIPVTEYGNGQYDVELETPESGFGGLFIECIWYRLNGIQLHLTTQVQITPDIYPYPSCYGEECYGSLV